ncbi:hypothetical protein HMPREF0765_1467 [Sphingobacterium spiritivorum ATCC 33300]|uniref:Peptidase M13 C-terminal domain-containing protein n=1 Tax=Sphingobacterium spiritivorum ATCC 33300 TaxID=525372 RepID=C2FVW1_SPHSI|nr:hypothetical protein HMPREF0765_1467 [Sphingobacterium spiritivorum ATCC 33300]
MALHRSNVSSCRGQRSGEQKLTDQYVVNQVKTDPHSPAQYRAFAPIVNMDGFHEAFQTKEGDKMYVPQQNRIVIW